MSKNSSQNFDGLRVTSFESRRSKEMKSLIERLGGVVRCAPSLRELPNPASPKAFEFAEKLLAGYFDVVVLLTGVGTRYLLSIMETKHPREQLIEALGRSTIVARGPKPVAALRELKLSPHILAAEPNTWREILEALDEAGSIDGKRIALQEYGQPNSDLVATLEERGAEVFSVSIYAWDMPEDMKPLRDAIAAVTEGKTDVVTFTSAQQVRNVLRAAGDMNLEAPFREAMTNTLVASIGPTCSETLIENRLGVDFEPDRVRMGDLIKELARSATMLLQRKRATQAAGIDTTTMRRIDAVWPASQTPEPTDPLQDSAFMKACRRQPVPYTPIWIMRQAGRYQRRYRDLRAKVSFLELCQNPELAAEVTLMAVDQLGVDAAIIFADILLITEPMGVGLSFNKGEGPSIARPIRSRKDVDQLQECDPGSLGYVYDAIRLTRRALRPDIPLIGFCGAPFTVASYMIEGQTSRSFEQTKSLMYRDPAAWHALLERISRSSSEYLNHQIEAGVQAVQLFDSWVGCLSEADYRQYVFDHTKSLIASIKPRVPVIHFGTNTTVLLNAIKEAGGDVIGVDWRLDLMDAWTALGDDVAVQGNLDPVVLFASPSEIVRRARTILDRVGDRPGHIFNLGHGILPNTPVDHVQALIDAVHEYSRREISDARPN